MQLVIHLKHDGFSVIDSDDNETMMQVFNAFKKLILIERVIMFLLMWLFLIMKSNL